VEDDEIRAGAPQLERQAGGDRNGPGGANRADTRYWDTAHHFANRRAAGVRDQHAVVDP
jgi:hypothetical protein